MCWWSDVETAMATRAFVSGRGRQVLADEDADWRRGVGDVRGDVEDNAATDNGEEQLGLAAAEGGVVADSHRTHRCRDGVVVTEGGEGRLGGVGNLQRRTGRGRKQDWRRRGRNFWKYRLASVSKGCTRFFLLNYLQNLTKTIQKINLEATLLYLQWDE
jgi:hypothetical protein